MTHHMQAAADNMLPAFGSRRRAEQAERRRPTEQADRRRPPPQEADAIGPSAASCAQC